MFDHIINFISPLQVTTVLAGQTTLPQPIYLTYFTLPSYFSRASSLISLVHTDPQVPSLALFFAVRHSVIKLKKGFGWTSKQ